MRPTTSDRTHGATIGPAIVAGLAAVTLSLAGCVRPMSDDHDERLAVVRRGNLETTVIAAGVTRSMHASVMRCGVEKIKGSDSVSRLPGGASTTILSVVPDGWLARKGEIVCRLDSSAHEAELIQRKILVAGARADWNRSRLDLEVAEGTLREYRDGLLGEQIQGFDARIAMGRSEVLTLTNRQDWLRRMLVKGYASKAQLSQCEGSLESSELDLAKRLLERGNLARYRAPAELRTLESRIEAAKANFARESGRLKLLEQRLEHLASQVELCTIRAPYSAVVVHANRPKKDFFVAPGALVRQSQELFELTDPDQVEVEVLLHETVMERVRAGMPARIRLEDSSADVLAGRVASVSYLPLRDRSKYASNEIAYYAGRVVFDQAPGRVRLGISAEIEIVTGRKKGALLAPVDSLVHVQGDRSLCRVRKPDRIELREVVTGATTSAMVEVLEGLEEREQVLLGGVGFPDTRARRSETDSDRVRNDFAISTGGPADE